MENTFTNLKLNLEIIQGLEKQGIKTPTEIQSLAIPHILNNKDIIGQSYTGSGKTLAYVAPLFEKIQKDRRENQVIILAPTHELVMQIDTQIKLLASNSGVPVTSTTIIGEMNIEKQIKKLKEKPHIVVGTPGRVLDLIKKKKISAHTVKTIVIDEADNLLDSSNSQTVKDVIKTTMRDRQLMFFSATISEKTLETAQSLSKEPIVLKAGGKVSLNPNISHMYILSDPREKFETLRKLIAAVNPEKAIVFVNKGYEIELITQKLNYHHKDAFGIYGNISKEERKVALDKFRLGKIKILVSSDLAARGLDIQGVTHIFSLDFPLNPIEYLHRAGRTARGTSSGTSICIATEKELAAIRIYEREFNIKIEPKKLYKGTLA